MAEGALSQVGRRRHAYEVQRLSDRDRLRQLLRADWPYSAYALGQLEPGLFERTSWWLASSEAGQGLVLHASGGLGPALVTLGDPEAVSAILHLHPGPRFSFATFQVAHKEVAERHFILMRKTLMQRMAVTAESFRPADAPAGPDVSILHLLGKDVSAVNRLYSVEGGPTNYTAANLEEGVYYGVSASGRLVSIAGTHVVAPGEDLAVVGNVLTHPRYRGHGYATLATGAVTEHLLRDCANVLLTVETENRPARYVYERLGYQSTGNLYETSVVRRQIFGVLATARRFLARRRGHGREVVIR
ncbi:MAG TPA: GNAT family N-acetyltransferase [Dehalococcoidia bacterium]|nr:GNAT family N-acetyltransferase [Dehalococcoidia bacterium]